MPPETICKIVRQYSKADLSPEDMGKLMEIGSDYGKVKNYVYQRYGGVKSLGKLYPGYTVQNEMTKSGVRESLGLPSVYFYLAVFEALGDIKNQWTRTKAAVLKHVNAHGELSEDDKHYIRYLLKVNNAFEAVLNDVPLNLPKDLQNQYDLLASKADRKKTESYLRRQVRNCHRKLHTDAAEGFSLTERAYRYGDHGIYISVKEKRKRIFIPLTDGNRYTRQIYLKLFPEEKRVELSIPVDIAVRRHPDYDSHVGISLGLNTMIVTDQGRVYGQDLSLYQNRLSDWIRQQSQSYGRNREANPGRKKYYANKRKLEEQLHSYINQELNRFLREEEPKRIYLPGLPPPKKASCNHKINYYSSMWQRGYIRDRLTLKCREQSIDLTEVWAKDISSQCSRCKAMGEKRGERFFCPRCGYETDRKQNAAQNAKDRGESLESSGQSGERR